MTMTSNYCCFGSTYSLGFEGGVSPPDFIKYKTEANEWICLYRTNTTSTSGRRLYTHQEGTIYTETSSGTHCFSSLPTPSSTPTPTVTQTPSPTPDIGFTTNITAPMLSGSDTISINSSEVSNFPLGAEIVLDPDTAIEETVTVVDHGSLIVYPQAIYDHTTGALIYVKLRGFPPQQYQLSYINQIGMTIASEFIYMTCGAFPNLCGGILGTRTHTTPISAVYFIKIELWGISGGVPLTYIIEKEGSQIILNPGLNESRYTYNEEWLSLYHAITPSSRRYYYKLDNANSNPLTGGNPIPANTPIWGAMIPRTPTTPTPTPSPTSTPIAP